MSSLHLRCTWQVEKNVYSCSLNTFLSLKKLAFCSTVPGTFIYVGQIFLIANNRINLGSKATQDLLGTGNHQQPKWHLFFTSEHLLIPTHDELLQNNCLYLLHSRDKPRLTSKILCNRIKNPAQFKSAFHHQSRSVVRWGRHFVLFQMSTRFHSLAALFLIHFRLRGDLSTCPGVSLS